jgi:hypothetical protein
LVAAAREHAVVAKSHFQAAEQAKAAAAEANRDAGIERARADALEKQLAKLQDLPAALEAAMRKTQAEPKQRKPVGSEQAVRGTGKRAKAPVGS